MCKADGYSMVDSVDKETRSRIMRSIKGKNTTPELIVRRLLYSRGFRFRICVDKLPGKPDIVLPKYRTIVLVHGCFWHGHICRIGSGNRKPKSNSKYWQGKISKNIQRDKIIEEKLTRLGWIILIIWECETKDPETLFLRLKTILDRKQDLIKQ